jgi:ribonuclease P protein component
MLPREHRLKKNAEFVRVLSGGSKFKAGPFLFFFCPGQEKLRLGIIISKKVAKLAVVRNRIRRVIQQLLRDDLDTIGAKTGEGVIMVLSLPGDDLRLIAQKNINLWLKKL